jgi:hypothetical protein
LGLARGLYPTYVFHIRRVANNRRHVGWVEPPCETQQLRCGTSQTDDSFDFSLPRNQISACAVLVSGVFPGAVGRNRAKHAAVKIPDIRIELRSKRIPGKREVGVVIGKGSTDKLNGITYDQATQLRVGLVVQARGVNTCPARIR